MKLLFSALSKFLMGLLLVGALLFVPAGSLKFVNGWLFIGLLFVPMLVLGAVLLLKAPKLLEKRLGAREEEKTQKGVVAAAGLLFVAGFIIAGLDFRFGWSSIHKGIVFAASVILPTLAINTIRSSCTKFMLKSPST